MLINNAWPYYQGNNRETALLAACAHVHAHAHTFVEQITVTRVTTPSSNREQTLTD